MCVCVCVDVLVGATDRVIGTNDIFSIIDSWTEMQAAEQCDMALQHCADESTKQQAGQQHKTPAMITLSQQVSIVCDSLLVGIV